MRMAPDCPTQNPFKFEKPMDGLQSTLSGLPTPAVYALGGLLVAALGGGAGLATNTALPGGHGGTGGRRACTAALRVAMWRDALASPAAEALGAGS